MIFRLYPEWSGNRLQCRFCRGFGKNVWHVWRRTPWKLGLNLKIQSTGRRHCWILLPWLDNLRRLWNLNLLLQVNNRSGWPPTMKDKLSVRYFMDLTEVFESGGTVDDVQISLGQNEGAKTYRFEALQGQHLLLYGWLYGNHDYACRVEMCEKDAHVTIKYRDGITGSNENDWSYQNWERIRIMMLHPLQDWLLIYLYMTTVCFCGVKNRLPAVMIPGLRRRRLQLSR